MYEYNVSLMFRVDFQNWRDEDDDDEDKEPFEEVSTSSRRRRNQLEKAGTSSSR